MTSLASELERAKALSLSALTDSIMAIGFECTRCGACCMGDAEDPHTATISPDEARHLSQETDEPWRNVVRPVPFGLDDQGHGVTFEWALQSTGCYDCRFFDDGSGEGEARCTIYTQRPAICRTYPFSISLEGTTTPQADPIDHHGSVIAHECEGLGREIDRDDARSLAKDLKRRSIRDLEEMIATVTHYRNLENPSEPTVIYDAEGPKRPDGSLISVPSTGGTENPDRTPSPDV